MCAIVSVGRTSVVFRSMFLALLKSSHPGLARAPIMCSHFPHGNEHVITCLARLVLASCTTLELIHEPSNYRLSPSLGIRSPDGLLVGLPPATLEFWVRFPNERNQGKQAHPVLKYRVPHGSQPRPGWAPDPLMVGIRSPDGLVVGSCTSHPGVLGSVPKREEPGKTGAPCVKVPGSSRVPTPRVH